MPFEFKFPDLGEGLVEGEILQWKVNVGDAVEAHQTILEVETDKAVMEVPSPVKGLIVSLKGKPGDMIRVGDVIATMGDVPEPPVRTVEAAPASGKKAFPRRCPRSAAPPEPYAVQGPSVGVVGALEEALEEDAQAAAGAGPEAPAAPSRKGVEALPRDRKLAQRLGVDIELIHGTGLKGRVTEEDVRRAAELGSPKKGARSPEGSLGRDAYGPVERVPLRGLRRRIARSMSESLARAAQASAMDEADAEALWRVKEKMKARAAEQGVRLTLLAFLVKAVLGALKRVPEMNASLDEDKQEIVYKAYYHIGVAVDTQDGLIVPNVKDADRKGMLQIARELEELSGQARRRAIDIRDLKGGTFTLTNYGSIGGLFGTPILNGPEAGILGVGRLAEKPVARDGALSIRRMLPLSLTFDHRIVDGAHAQHFLNDIIRHVEDPDLLFLDDA